MKRHSKAGKKAQRPRPPISKRPRKQAAPGKVPAAVRTDTQRARLAREPDEAIDHQAAMTEILEVLSRSDFDLQTILDTLVASATRLCHGDQGHIFLRQAGVYRLESSCGFTSECEKYLVGSFRRPNRAGNERQHAVEMRAACAIDCIIAHGSGRATSRLRKSRFTAEQIIGLDGARRWKFGTGRATFYN
jgi:hypothetical protein